jgi:Na+-translocating ferredoxin:NAD+ oxidoreductase RNF subunit RnfB
MDAVTILPGDECDNCGNELEQEFDGEAGICTSCGAPIEPRPSDPLARTEGVP